MNFFYALLLQIGFLNLHSFNHIYRHINKGIDNISRNYLNIIENAEIQRYLRGESIILDRSEEHSSKALDPDLHVLSTRFSTKSSAISTDAEKALCSLVQATTISKVYTQWQCSSSNNVKSNPCVWTGIVCDNTANKVISIDLSYVVAFISGSIPSSIGLLTDLTSFNLNTCGFTGLLPSTLGLLSALQDLHLNQNFFTGTLPTSLSLLSQLSMLEVGYNSLYGIVPSAFQSLVNLKTFVVADNSLTGTFPSFITTLTTLVHLDLASNSFTGIIPTAIGGLRAMSYLYVGSNSLTGIIPTAIGQLSYLIILAMRSNRFVGALPSSLGYLTSLQALRLYDNDLTGSIPTSWSHLKLLRSMDVSDNALTGTVPSFLGSMDAMEEILLDNNKFIGTLPTSLGNLQSLMLLSVRGNKKLIGAVPFSLCDTPLSILYSQNTSISCYPSCLKVSHLELLGDIPHCYDEQDITLCQLSSIFKLPKLMLEYPVPSQTIVYESKHPRYQFDATGAASVTFISFRYATEYIITFDSLTHTLCPIRFCRDVLCTRLIRTYSGARNMLPGVGKNPPLVLVRRNGFYLSIGDLFCEGPSSEWGYKVTVGSSGHGMGWSCDAVPARTDTGLFPVVKNQYATDPCSWTGVTCLGNANVVGLDLKAVGIVSSIPQILGTMTSLTALDLSYNLLSGTLPATICNLSSLQFMDLSRNRLGGDLSSTLCELQHLTSLSLADNRFSGTLPAFLSTLTNLSYINLRTNGFSGKVSNALCMNVDLRANSTVILANNPQLSCYEDCWEADAAEVFENTLLLCAPTSAPTLQPTSPTVSPTPAVFKSTSAVAAANEIFTQAAVVGIVVGGFIALIMLFGLLYYATRRKTDSETKKRQFALRSLSVHRTAYGDDDITADLLDEFRHTIKMKDYDGKNVLDIILERESSCHISNDLLFSLIEDSLPFDKNSGDLLDPTDHDDSWAHLIQKNDARSVAVVSKVLSVYRNHIAQLAYSKDGSGRVCVDIASAACKELITRSMLLYGRFEMSAAWIHRSATCEVWIARYHPMGESLEDGSLASADKGYGARSMALKFMKHRDQFVSELDRRQEGDFDEKHVISIVMSFDSDCGDLENRQFRDDAILKGFANYPYCIVMEAGDMCLMTIIQHNNVAGKDWTEIRRILRHVLVAVAHIHERGIVHGDLKPMNVMATGSTFKLIDLDASANMNKNHYIGAKFSSSYSPPEMLYMNDGGKVMGRSYTRDPTNGCPSGNYPYELVLAKTSYDMWAVGALLYYLSTGSSLFPCDAEDNMVDSEDMLNLYQWSDQVKTRKLQRLSDPMRTSTSEGEVAAARVRNLLSLLLYRDAEKRPTAIQALEHPFFTGKQPVRMQGDEAAYDVFLSYRVDSDALHVALLYHALIFQGLKVWWDKECLEPGVPWEEGFCDGLVNSTFFVCILSREAINHPTKDWQNFSTFEKTSRYDNVLLEWRLALELKARGMIEGILPIFIGDLDIAGEYNNYFRGGCHCNTLIDVAVDSIEDKLLLHLDRQALGGPYYTSADNSNSVKAVVTEVTSNQGGFVEGLWDNAMSTIVPKIVRMVRRGQGRGSSLNSTPPTRSRASSHDSTMMVPTIHMRNEYILRDGHKSSSVYSL